MKIIKKIVIVLVVLIGLVAIVSAFLPGTVVVKRSRLMPFSKATAAEKVNVLQNWPKWMTWAKLDSAAVYTFSAEPATGKGAFYTWKGNDDMGEGKMTITDVFGTDSTYMEVEFKDQGTSKVMFNFFEKEKGTEVTWTMQFEMPFMMRIMGLFMDGMMASDFEGGLEGIEKLGVSEPSSTSSAMEFKIEDSKPMMCLSMIDSCVVDPKTMEQKYGMMYGAIEAEIKAQKLEKAGAPCAVTIRYDMDKNFLVFSPGIPVSGEVKNVKNKKITFSKCEAQKSLVYDYFGNYMNMQATYDGMYKYIADNKLEVAGMSWEEYLTDPMTEPDTAKWNTKIYIPIK